MSSDKTVGSSSSRIDAGDGDCGLVGNGMSSDDAEDDDEGDMSLDGAEYASEGL